jgi:1-acyl-sn-glycerol-3-phosphate acyltransferase
MNIVKFFSNKILKLIGWELNIVLPEEKKFVLIGAPHTSNWDFPLALLAFGTLDIKISWVGKIEIFWGPLYYLFTYLGGIPVDRSASQGFIEQITKRFEEADDMVLSLAPEGTRSRAEYWKSGFYHISRSAKVPICLAYIDYGNRRMGFDQVLYPSGNIDADMEIIADYYQNIKGRLPQNQGPVRMRKH